VQSLAAQNRSELPNLLKNLQVVFVNAFSDTATETIKIPEIAGYVVDLVPEKDQQAVMSALVEMDSSTSEISRYQLDEIIDALEEEILQGGDDSRIESLDSSIVSVTESQSSYFDNLGDDSQTDTTDNRSEEIS